MYLATGEIIGIIIALISALIVLALAMKDNARLNKYNTYLRKRNLELTKKLENSVERPVLFKHE
jgi:hypothetical protein